jgi:hypothetical protein
MTRVLRVVRMTRVLRVVRMTRVLRVVRMTRVLRVIRMPVWVVRVPSRSGRAVGTTALRPAVAGVVGLLARLGVRCRNGRLLALARVGGFGLRFCRRWML